MYGTAGMPVKSGRGLFADATRFPLLPVEEEGRLNDPRLRENFIERVLLTGATGFIGRALIPRLQRDGHAVVAWVRSPARARSQLGAEVEWVSADAGFEVLVRAIERAPRS